MCAIHNKLPPGSDQKGVLGFESITVAILPYCHPQATMHLQCMKLNLAG